MLKYIGALLLVALPALATPADPAKTAADALVAAGCTIERETPRFIAVSCPGQPVTRIMRMPR